MDNIKERGCILHALEVLESLKKNSQIADHVILNN